MTPKNTTETASEPVRETRTAPGPPPIVETILETVGNTPMVRLRHVAAECPATVLAKVESFNPGGSVKDRIAVAIVQEAEAKGLLKPGGTIVEATSGNTGMGLALVASVKGYRAIFVMPDKVSKEKINLLKSFGAEVVITPTALPPDSPESYYEVAKRIGRELPGAYLANQYYNPTNPEAHFRTTGPEIWKQTEGKVDYFVAGLGTGGTISGTARYLKQQNPKIKVIGADPIGSILRDYFYTKKMVPAKTYKVEGIGEDFLPGTLDFSMIDEVIPVNDAQSLNLARRLAREEGILAGGSSGTALFAALQVARQAKPGQVVVVLIPDTGERYLSKVHSDEWMRDNRLLDSSMITVADVMTGKRNHIPPLVSINYDDTVDRALSLIREFNISQLPVLKEGNVVGSVSEGVLLQKVLDGSAHGDTRVEYLLEKPLPLVPLDAHLPRVMKVLAASNAAVAVDQHGKPAGILTRFDLLEYINP
ncbi:MAG: cystathionine beta-synthase [Candidatus Eisenbacteria bacterium]|uniref:Cystathionine beta-synthase n=1 Tax=Eiseniibacteriota bacterium TaxID=2212470 RepID=A0A538TRF8_UNCEI|nr:MAG: cystathionine beta-synthase [Candidatus Eisenbacteria bacterium]